MDDYRKPPKINRYWKRPKNKIYDCNVRDAERFYQDSYKEYRAEKEFRQRGWHSDSLSDRFAHLRAGPIRREHSVQPYSSFLGESSTLAGRSTSVTQEASEATKTTFKSESKPVSVYDPQKENQSLEERLERLRRLREDLGLPSETETSKSTLRDSVPRSVANDYDTSYKSDRSPRVRTRATASATKEDSSSYSYKSERKSRMNGVGTTASDDYKYKSDFSSDDFKLPPRRERKTEDTTPKIERKTYSSRTDSLSDDLSFGKSEKKAERFSKLSTSASSSSPIRSRKAAPAAESLEFDDDDFDVAKMMKKLPSSQEILDRISKMELDD